MRALPQVILLLSLLLLLTACGQTAPPAEAPPSAPSSATELQPETPSEPDGSEEPASSASSESDPAVSEPPENPGGLYMSELLEMTTGDIFDLWGADVTYYDDWYFGSAKYFSYEDGRVPYTFSFNDADYRGAADGSEPLLTVGYFAWNSTGVTMAAPGLPIEVTHPQLQSLAPDGTYYGEVSEGDEIHDGASAYYVIPLTDHADLTYLWLEGSDPETAPADTVTLSCVPHRAG